MRPWRLADALALPELANDIDVARYLPPRFPSPYRLHDAQTWIRNNLDADPTLLFAIECDGALTGSIGLYLGEIESGRGGTAAIGYWLGKPFWGRGIVSDAVTAVSAYAFGELRVRRLCASVVAANVASARVLLKTGFALEATLRSAFVDRDGIVHDELIFARIAGE
jgi:RimJ/RimL family protein N-acetyltransferase